MNDKSEPRDDMAWEDLIHQLNLLDSIDCHLTPEHIAKRFRELPGDTGDDGPPKGPAEEHPASALDQQAADGQFTSLGMYDATCRVDLVSLMAASVEAARGAAADIVADARQQAEASADELRRAHQAVAAARQQAEQIVADARAEADKALGLAAEMREEAERILAKVRAEAGRIITAARNRQVRFSSDDRLVASVGESVGGTVRLRDVTSNRLPRALPGTGDRTATTRLSMESHEVLQAISLTGTGNPTVMRILLGVRLRRLREASRISVDQAAYVLRASPSKISRLENGRVSVKDRDIIDLLAFYGVTDEALREELRAMAARANSRGWWGDYSDILPGWFEEYIGLEQAAIQIRGYEVQLIPGLLQTEDYARAVTLLEHSNPKEISRRVSLRMTRQAILSRPKPTSFSVVLDEAVLRRPIGGPSVMGAQLKHLIAMSQRPNVTIQVIPFKIGGHLAVGCPFSVLHFAEKDLSDVVYLEQLASSQYLDKQDMIDKYLAMMERLCQEAATPAESVERLQAMLSEARTPARA